MDRYTIETMRQNVEDGVAHVFADGIAWVKLFDWIYEGPIGIYVFDTYNKTFCLLRIGKFAEDQKVQIATREAETSGDIEFREYIASLSIFNDDISFQHLDILQSRVPRSQKHPVFKQTLYDDKLLHQVVQQKDLVLRLYAQEII